MTRKANAPESNSPKIKRTRHQTLGFLGEQILNGLTRSEAVREIRQVISGEAFQAYCAPFPEPIKRTVDVGTLIRHDSFPMPPYWGEPAYSIYRVFVEKGKPKPAMWMSHSGEECLYTESEAGIAYNMFWPRTGEDSTIPVDDLEVFCRNGQIVRILPNVPHWNSAETDSTAWMAIRHLSGSTEQDEEPQPSNLTPRTNRKRADEGPPSARAFTLDEVKEPSRAFVLLSDFRGQLQVARQRAGLSIAQLSSQCDMHSTYIWKAERGEANLSLLTVNTLARVVRLDMSRFGLPEYFPDPNWSMEKPDTTFARFLPYQLSEKPNDELLEDGVPYPLLNSPAEYQHWLHPARCNLKKGSELRFCPKHRNSHTDMNEPWSSTSADPGGLGCFGRETWIVLEGKLSFESDETELLLSPKYHPVLHLRTEAKGVLRAYEDSRLLRIVFSAFCSCRHPQPAEQPKP